MFICTEQLEYHMNKDQEKGDVRHVKDSANKTTGKAFGNKSLEKRGKIASSTDNAQEDRGNGGDERKK